MKLVRVRVNDIDHYSLSKDGVTYYVDGELKADLFGDKNIEIVKENASQADLDRLKHDIKVLNLKYDVVEE